MRAPRASTTAPSWRATTRSVVPASRSASVSPTHTIGTSPFASAAAALAATSSSLSPCIARRSEWPTMTWLQPSSASIAADTSPV
jgi:hypothetical protein